MRMITLFIAVCVFSPSLSMGSEPLTAANDFWKIFVQGDVSSFEQQYADVITLKAGSEFLKPRWKINMEGADRSKDKQVTKAELMSAYKTMFDQIGNQKWQGIFGAIKKDKIHAKVLANKHVLLTVETGPGDDYMEFELALNKKQTRWLVVLEYTDF